MLIVSFIGTCVNRDSTSKLTSRSVGCSRIFWILCMKSVELVMCDSVFPVRGCNVFARKRDRLNVGDFMALTIGLKGTLSLCIFGSPYSLGGRGFVGFNVFLVSFGMLLFFHKVPGVLCDCVGWILVKLSIRFIREQTFHLFLVV